MGTACKVPGYSESHGEAVSFKRDGSALLTLSDGNGTTGLPVHLYVAR
jgi:hypothetical protein